MHSWNNGPKAKKNEGLEFWKHLTQGAFHNIKNE
jgi:hypothetical protein